MSRFKNVVFTVDELDLVLNWQTTLLRNRVVQNYTKVVNQYPIKHGAQQLIAKMEKMDLEAIWEVLKSNEEDGFLIQDSRIPLLFDKFNDCLGN